jgi:ABC-type Na+ efflux pump permease subunit
MNSEGGSAIKALVWKESHNLLPFIAFCSVITAVVFLYVVFGNPHGGENFIDRQVAYAPFIVAIMSGCITIISIKEEMVDRTLEALLCTPMSLTEIILSKYLFIVIFPFFLSFTMLLALLAGTGMPVLSGTVLYQMIADLPMVSIFLLSVMMAWLLRQGTLYGILSFVGGTGFILSTIMYFFPPGFVLNLSILPLSPVSTTIFLAGSLFLLFLMIQKIGSIEKSDVI